MIYFDQCTLCNLTIRISKLFSIFGFQGKILFLIIPVPCHRLHYENTPMQYTAIFHG